MTDLSKLGYLNHNLSRNFIPKIRDDWIENIAKIIRVDLVWRMTHNTPGISPLGIRARYAFNF